MRRTPFLTSRLLLQLDQEMRKKKNENPYIVSKRPKSWLVQFYHVHRIVVVMLPKVPVVGKVGMISAIPPDSDSRISHLLHPDAVTIPTLPRSSR